MGKKTLNPIAHAAFRMRKALNKHGAFNYVKRGTGADEVRFALAANHQFTLLERMSDLDGDMTSLFSHAPSGALVLVQEWRCHDSDCDVVHGQFLASAHDMDSLTTIVNALDNDDIALEEYLEFMHENRRGPSYGDWDDSDADDWTE